MAIKLRSTSAKVALELVAKFSIAERNLSTAMLLEIRNRVAAIFSDHMDLKAAARATPKDNRRLTNG
jgi:hypothetical protein